MEETVRQLALVYAGVMLINLAFSGLLWFRYRTSLHRDLFMVWATGVVFLLWQAIPARGTLWLALSCLPIFPVSYTLAHLLGSIAGFPIRKKLYLVTLAIATVLSVIIALSGGEFWAAALPPSIAVALPLIDTPLRAFLRPDARLTLLGKAAMVTALISGLHDLDFPFLRDKPEFGVTGFSVALLIVFGISITAPGTVLERATEERTRAQQQNEFQRRFFANVTHELRTPLTMILAPLESMLGGEFGSLTSTQRSYLEAGWRNGVRLLKLINDLLDLAKLEEGFLKLRPVRTDLRPLLDALVEDARPLATRKFLKLDLVIDATPTDLHIDREKMERVLVNLISNALKFTEAGQVTIRAGVNAGAVEISVTDTGLGIPEAQLPHLFERFNQGDGSVTRRYGGTGIGLAYAKEIVELHGGRIAVESTPGRGSKFTVHLQEGNDQIPLRLREETAADEEPREWAERLKQNNEYRFAEIAAPAIRQRVSSGSESKLQARILLVEDNVEILDLMAMHLRDTYVVLTAEDGQEGLEIAQRECPDLIVTDFMMPKVDGLSMLKALRSNPKLSDVPVIFLTSRNQLQDRLLGREAGADVYLTKPFSPRELEAAIRQQLEKRGRQVQSLMRAHVEGLEIVSAGLAHEIQNPLNFIKNAQLLIAENVDKLRQVMVGMPGADATRTATVEKAQQKIGRMVESAGRGVERIENVVGLMRRYAREGYPTEPVAVDLDRAVADVAELVAPRTDVDCQLTLSLASAHQMIRVVPEDLNQVIRSLVQNAVEAVEGVSGGGRVNVKTRFDDKHVILEVTDNGPGIAPDDLTKIFSPFFSTKGGSGRGLGLPIVQIVVARAGGTIEISSVQRVETTFRIQFPPMPAVASVPAVPGGDKAAPGLSLPPA